MARLLDRLVTRSGPLMDPIAPSLYDGFTAMSQTFIAGDTEKILPTFPSWVTNGYHGNGVVFSVILQRLMLFSQAQAQWQNQTTKRLFGTPELSLLENPWPNGTIADLLARMIQDVDLAGNSFTYMAAPDRLERWRPDWVDIASAPTGDGDMEVVGFIYRRDGTPNSSEFHPVDEVAHWAPIPDPMARNRGMSWLTPVIREINSDLALTDHKAAYLANNATPNLVVKYTQSLEPKVRDAIRNQWDARFGGPDNAWKTAILDGGADVTVVGNNFEQMAFTAVQGAGETRIAAAGGVPPIVVGLKEGLAAATYSNYSSAYRAFGSGTMRWLWQSAFSALATLIPAPSGARLWYDVSDVASLHQDEKDAADTMQVLAAAASTLLTAGYEADSVTAAISSGDITLLSHTGLISVQLLPGGIKAIKDELAAGMDTDIPGQPPAPQPATATTPPSGGTP